MRAAKSIALNMVGEALNRLVFQILLVFAICFMVGGFFFTYLDPGEEGKMLKDLGLTVITIFGMLMAIFLGVGTVAPEVDRRTIYCLIAKPVKRHAFFMGKFLGTAVILGISCLVMGLFLVIALYVKEQDWNWGLMPAIGLTYLTLLLVAAVVMAVSTFASQLLSIVAGFVFWGLGHSQSFLGTLRLHSEGASRTMLDVVGRLFPNLAAMDLRQWVVDQVYIPPSYLMVVTAMAAAYLVVILVIGMIAFNQRQL